METPTDGRRIVLRVSETFWEALRHKTLKEKTSLQAVGVELLKRWLQGNIFLNQK